jgi:hypothetical protein
MSIANRHRVLSGGRAILADDEAIQQLEGGILLQPALFDGSVIAIHRPRLEDGAAFHSLFQNARCHEDPLAAGRIA